jgi:hypothetical protein
MDPLLASSMQQAAYKCETVIFELKSSATFELSNIVNGPKFEKLLSFNEAQENLWAIYGPIAVKLLMVSINCVH